MILTIEATTVDELAKKIRELADYFGPASGPALGVSNFYPESASNPSDSSYATSRGLNDLQPSTQDVQSPAPALVADSQTETKPKPRRGRPPKKAAAKPVAEPEQAPAPEASEYLLNMAESVIEAAIDLATSEVETAPAAETPKPEELQEQTVPSITKDQCVSALQALTERTDVERARELLADFGVRRLGELPEDKYGALVQACEAIA